MGGITLCLHLQMRYLEQLNELLLRKEPALLDSFLQEMAPFQVSVGTGAHQGQLVASFLGQA